MIAALFLTAGASEAQADARVEVRVIYATKGKKYIHPKLKDLESYFGRFGAFTSFEPVQQKTLSLKLSQTGAVTLPTGQKLNLIFRGVSKDYVKLRFKLSDMEMNIRIHDGGLFFHSGVPFRDGRLVISIRASET